MRGATCFSGIGAPECAAPWVDWRWSAEIEPFPAAVHAHRFPSTVNLGNVLAPDFLARASAEPIDILVGGPPCQAFSIAGLRNSLADARGNLTLRWVQVIHAVRPGYSVTENVPGWLSTKDNAFGCFLAGLVGADDPLRTPDGRSWPDAGMAAGPLGRAAWRVLDAQYFGVPQRRRRVFVVWCPPDGGDPAAVLFERKGVHRHPAAGRTAGEDVARPLAAGSASGGGYRNDADTADNLIATTLRARDAAKGVDSDCTDTLIPVAYGGNNQAGPIDVATARNAHAGPHGRLDFETETFVVPSQVLAYGISSDAVDRSGEGDGSAAQRAGLGIVEGASPALRARSTNAVAEPSGVRRLMPLECERLQGFPDGWTGIVYRGKPAADGPRYKAIGNSMAVPVLGWLLDRVRADALRACAAAYRVTGNDGAYSTGDAVGALGTMTDPSAQVVVPIMADALRGVGTAKTPSADAKGRVRLRDPGLGIGADGDPAGTLGAYGPGAVGYANGVRRLLPVECERLQGFPDGWTDIVHRGKPAADGNRYKAIGNSMAVPVLAWLLGRVEQEIATWG